MNELQFVIDFYQKAWETLLWFIGILTAVLGIIWPIIIFFINREKGKNYEKNIDNIFTKKRTEYDNYFTESMRKIDEKSKDLDERISKIENNEIRLSGSMLLTSAMATNDHFQKMFGFLQAFINFIKIEDNICMAIVFSNMSPYFQKGQTLLTSSTISAEQKQILVNNVDDVINTLKQKSEKIDSKLYIGIFEGFKKQLLNI
jgi:hypothetical protein